MAVGPLSSAGMEGLQPDEDVQLVIDLELRLLEPQVRASAGELDRLLHPGFVEFGASGRKWDRSEIIASLIKEQPMRRPIMPHIARELGHDVAVPRRVLPR